MRASRLEVLVEEESMERMLAVLLPRLVGGVPFSIRRFRGKHDLLARLPGVLKGRHHVFAHDEGARLLVVVDQDSQDCRKLKALLEDAATRSGFSLCRRADGQPGTVLNRIAVEELEAWFLGDIPALVRAYPRVSSSLASQSRFRDPDAIRGGTWETLERILQRAGYHKGGLRKISLADDVAPHLDLENNRSHSFRAFVSGVRFLVEGAA